MTGHRWWVWAALAWPGLAFAEPDSSDEEDSEIEEDGGFDIEVIGGGGLPARVDSVSVDLPAEAGARTPGVQGDPVKAVQTLGANARVAVNGSGLSLWGSAPSESRLYIDDIPVPTLFHLGSSRSILPAHTVSSLRLMPAGARARYGRGLGGAVAVRTAAPAEPPLGATVSIDPIDAGAGVHGRWKRGWVAISGRHSLLQETANWVAPERSSELVPIPTYADVQIRAQHDLGDGDRLSVLILGSRDQLDRGIASVQPDAAFSETTEQSFSRVGLRLDRAREEGQSTVLAWAGRQRSDRQLDYGDVNANDAFTRYSAGVLLSHECGLGPWLTVRAGLDAEAHSTVHQRTGAVALPAREGDIRVFGQPPGDRVNRDEWRIGQASAAGFITATATPTSTLVVSPGVRVQPQVLNGDRVLPVRPTEPPVGLSSLATTFDPRLRVSWSPVPRLRLFGVTGRYHQAPTSEDLSPVFGSPKLGNSRAWHGVVGLRATPIDGLTAELTTFLIRQDGLAVRTPAPTPAIAQLLVSEGDGRSTGAQLSVDAVYRGLYSRVSYTIQRAQRRGAGETDLWRAFDLDQRHGLQASVGGEHASGFELGARLEVASGFPRTDVLGAVFDARGQRFDPIFGEHNQGRLPLFASLSARVAYPLTVDGIEIKLWLDALNLSNHKNVEELFYSPDYRQQGQVLGLPALVLLGAQVSL